MDAAAEPHVEHAGAASPPPYDPLLPAPAVEHLRPSPTNQVTQHAHPVSMDTPTETPHDLFCLAKEYERRGRLPDAANLYLKASMNGHLSAMVSYASHLVATDERAAFVWFRAAAERGDPRAWAELGQLLARGRYFEVNAIDAARCWKRAAQMGDNAGKSALGLCYIRGFGVKQDAEKGIEIVRQVADVHNDVTAMKNLAWIYRHGKGAPKNVDEAEYWDARAKKQEKLMAHISTREQVLFGRGRFSRHSKHKSSREPRPTTPREAVAHDLDHPADSSDPALAVHPDHDSRRDTRATDRRQPFTKSNNTILVEEDLENRLRAVRDDPSRRSPSPPPSAAALPHSNDQQTPAVTTTATATAAAGTAAAALVSETRNEIHDRPIEIDPSKPPVAGPSTLPSASATTSATTDESVEPHPQPEKRRNPLAATAAAVGAAAGAVGATAAAAFSRNRPSSAVVEPQPEPEPVAESEPKPKQDPEPDFPVQDSELESRALDGRAASSNEQVLASGAVVKDLEVVPSDSAQPVAAAAGSATLTTDFDLPHDELDAVRQTAAKAAEEARIGGSSAVAAGVYVQRSTEQAGSPTGLTGGAAADIPKDIVEEQFLTPEQSLDNEEEDASDLLKPATAVAATAAIGFGAQSLRSDDNEDIDEVGVGAEAGAEPALIAVPVRDFGVSQVVEGDVPTEEQAREAVAAAREDDLPQVQPGIEGTSPHPLSPGVKSRAMFFENSGATDGLDADGQPGPRRGASYALPPGGGSTGGDHTSGDLEDFENADMVKMTHDGSASRPSYNSDAPVACKITRMSRFSRDGKAGARAYSQGKDGGFGGDSPTHEDLRNLLTIYPKNPLRSDSQVPLFNLLNTIQRFPASDTEAYNIVEQGNGFSKIIVAMLSHHEDEFLQEQGLHSFVRIVRSSPSSQRENLVLMSYGDCYRNAMGDVDAVVPKGSLGIDERSSGAIQAIVQALRHHAGVRRVQLAGCAGLGEVAGVSSSCRSIAYDHGAITLIISCLRHRSSQAACTIHDIACRAMCSFCTGKENFAFKEAFASAGAVSELLSVLQLWGHAEDVTSEMLTTVTKNCCLALRHIADGCSIASEQCVQSYAYHHMVRVMVLRRNDVSVCTIVVSAMSAITRHAGSIAEKGLQDAKPLPEVLVTMQTHSEQPLFIRKCLDFMEALGSFSSMKEEIVLAGGIPFAADIVQQGGSDSLLLERSCGVIEKLCRSNPKNQEIFASNNGILSLTSLLGTHQSLPGVVERALLALTSACANNSKTQKEAVKVGAPDQVMRSLGTYSAKNSKVVAGSASAMAAMVVPRNAALAQSFAKLKAPELVVRAMKRHPDSVMVQENGSAAIASFCEADPRIIAMLLKSGISSILVVGLQRFLHKQTAVVQIVRAMRALSNEASEESYRFKSKLLTDRSNESALSEIFHTALSYHKKGLPETANVIISICATINRLCMRSVAFKNEVGKDGIVEELKKLVERTAEYRDLGALQPVLATICTLVLDSEDNKNRFHAVGGVEAILDVMQKWKSDTYVLEHCCAALRYSCNEHFGNCDEVKNHNGVRSILGVMELHPENVNVTLWCCLTLADLCKGDEELQSSPSVTQGIRKVVSAMSMFSSNSRFLASACEFLRAASVDNADNQERIVRLGGRTLIVRAMEAHPQDQTLTESGAYALLQVQDVQDARSSVDSQTQLGLVKRLSRDLRRSGSTSNRSNRSSGKVGLLGRKSRSFSARRKPVVEEPEEDGQAPLNQGAPEENPSSRPSLITFSRGGRSRIRKGKSAANIVPVEDLGEGAEAVENEERYDGGAEDGYDEFNPPPPGPVRESDAQID